jgi:hypothetical protein
MSTSYLGPAATQVRAFAAQLGQLHAQRGVARRRNPVGAAFASTLDPAFRYHDQDRAMTG